MRTRTLVAAPMAALAIAVTAAPAAAIPAPSPNPGHLAVNTLPAGPEAVLDLPEERTESDVLSYRLVLDDSTSDRRRPIVQQSLEIVEPDGDRIALAWASGPGAHAQTSVMFDEPGTWTFTLTVTTLVGETDTVTETVEVLHDLSVPPPWDGGEAPEA